MFIIKVALYEGMPPREHRRNRRDDVLIVVSDALDEIERGEAHSVAVTTDEEDDEGERPRPAYFREEEPDADDIDLDDARHSLRGDGEQGTAKFLLTADAWTVLDEKGQFAPSGFIVRPCPRDHADNAIGSVLDDEMESGLSTLVDALDWIAENHPGEDFAAYIRKEGDGTFTAAA